jgi:hypothetical protein
VSGVELLAGIVAAFFASGIVMGVLAVIALSAMRGHRKRANRRRRSDRPGWEDPPGPDGNDDNPPRWPGGYHGLIARRVRDDCPR